MSMKITLIVVIVNIFSFPIFSQTEISTFELDTIRRGLLSDKTPYYVIRKKNKYGVKKENGAYIIPIEYTNIKSVSNDYIWGQKKNKNYFISLKNGKTIISGFNDIKDPFSSLFEIQKKGKVGLFSKDLGKLVVPIKYDFIEKNNKCSYFRILHKGKYRSLYFPHENKLIDKKFESLEIDYRLLVAKYKQEKYFYKCGDGQLIYNTKANEYEFFSNAISFKENGKWKIQSFAKDAVKATLEFEDYTTKPIPVGEYGTFVKTDGKWGVCNLGTQKMILEANYDSLAYITFQSRDVYYFKTFSVDRKVGVINNKGERLLEEKYEDVELTFNSANKKITFWIKEGAYYSPMNNGKINKDLKYTYMRNRELPTPHVVTVKKGDKFGAFNTFLGREIMPCVNDTIYWLSDNTFIFEKENRHGLFSKEGEILLDSFAELKRIKYRFVKVINDDGKIGVYDSEKRKYILDIEYDEVEWIVSSYNPHMFRKGKYSGVVDFWEEKIVIPLESEYEEIIARHGVDFIDEKMATRAKKNDKWGWVDIKTGEVVIPFRYNDAHSFNRGETAEVKLKYRWVKIDKLGNVVN